MKSDLKKYLQQLNNFDLLLILAHVSARWLRFKLSRLHPARIALPITALQVAFFVLALSAASHLIPTLALINLFLVALVLIPTTLRKPPPKIQAHWIRPHE